MFLGVTWLLAVSAFPNQYPQWPEAQYWGVALATSLLFFLSILAHELGHSVVAMRNGIRVRSITLFIFGGVAQIAKDAPRPLIEGLIAIAGPLVSLALGGGFLGLYYVARDTSEPAGALLLYLGQINIAVAAFNMVPGFPLDGGRVFRAIAWGVSGNFSGATRSAVNLGKGIGYACILGGLALGFWTHDVVNGLWLAFVGWFLAAMASQSGEQALVRDTLRGVHVSDLMTAEPALIPSWIDLRGLVSNYIGFTDRRCFLVGDDGHWLGMLHMKAIEAVPRQRWADTLVGDIMVPRARVRTVRPSEELVHAIEAMEESDVSLLPVVDNGSVVGLLSREQVLRLIRTRQRLAQRV